MYWSFNIVYVIVSIVFHYMYLCLFRFQSHLQEIHHKAVLFVSSKLMESKYYLWMFQIPMLLCTLA